MEHGHRFTAFHGSRNPDLRLLSLPEMEAGVGMSPCQNLREFRCSTLQFEPGNWVRLSGCSLLETIWLSFEWATSVVAEHPVTFPALRHLILATGEKRDLMMLARISVMPLLQTAVFSAPNASRGYSVLDHLRDTLPATCEVEIKDSGEWHQLRNRTFPSLSDQLGSDGSFGWEDDESTTESSSESEESYSD